jgi:hypothetical protein
VAILSYDEKPGIQAIARRAVGVPSTKIRDTN